jgi:uncharacterized integral membrane protein
MQINGIQGNLLLILAIVVFGAFIIEFVYIFRYAQARQSTDSIKNSARKRPLFKK